jgi:hypothetical protein
MTKVTEKDWRLRYNSTGDSRMGLLLLFGSQREVPTFVLKALLVIGDPTREGRLIEAEAPAWFAILKRIQSAPQTSYDIDPRTWEETIAGAYTQAGFDEVILTPRSGRQGRRCCRY